MQPFWMDLPDSTHPVSAIPTYPSHGTYTTWSTTYAWSLDCQTDAGARVSAAAGQSRGDDVCEYNSSCYTDIEWLPHWPECVTSPGPWQGPQTDDYLMHFQMISAWNRCNLDDKAVQLTINLTGIAKQAWVDSFSDLSTPVSYESLVAALTMI